MFHRWWRHPGSSRGVAIQATLTPYGRLQSCWRHSNVKNRLVASAFNGAASSIPSPMTDPKGSVRTSP
jgi:hypothetical protein